MNIVRLMKPTVNTVVLRASQSFRRGLEIMRKEGFTAIPVLDEEGKYIGCITEGDYLRHILSVGSTDMLDYDKCKVGDLVRRDFCPALEITADENQVIESALNQNFTPIIDARGCMCGIVTRHAVIKFLAQRKYEEDNGAVSST